MGDLDQLERHLRRAEPRAPEGAVDRRVRAAIAAGGSAQRGASWRRWGASAAAGILLGVGAAALSAGPVLTRVEAGSLASGGRLAEAGSRLAPDALWEAVAPSRLSLSDGSCVEARPGARLRIVGAREVELASGEALFRVARKGSGSRFSVRTPRGPVEVLGTSFVVSVREERMGRKAKAGAVVSVAVVSGVVLFHYLGGDPAERERHGRLEAGQIGTAWEGGYERRKGGGPSGTSAAAGGPQGAAEEQARLSTLRGEIEREKALARSLDRQIGEAARSSGAEKPSEGEGESEEGAVLDDLFSIPSPAQRPAIGPDDAAELLGLDASRAARIERMHAETTAKFRAAADERTSVRREGNVTNITVGTYTEEARRILEEWGHGIEALLSPGERERYRKYGMESGLFGQPGSKERRFVLTGSDDSLKAQERGGNEFGEWWMDADPKAIQERFKRQLEGGR